MSNGRDRIKLKAKSICFNVLVLDESYILRPRNCPSVLFCKNKLERLLKSCWKNVKLLNERSKIRSDAGKPWQFRNPVIKLLHKYNSFISVRFKLSVKLYGMIVGDLLQFVSFKTLVPVDIISYNKRVWSSILVREWEKSIYVNCFLWESDCLSNCTMLQPLAWMNSKYGKFANVELSIPKNVQKPKVIYVAFVKRSSSFQKQFRY